VTGRVMDEDGRPLEGAAVSILDTSLGGTTNREGWYLIEEVPVGEYYVKASIDGYRSESKPVRVEQNMPRTVDFALPPGQSSSTTISDETPPSKERSFAMDYTTSGVLTIVFAFMALAGALTTYTLSNHWAAVGLSTAAIFSFGFGAGSVLAIAALALIILARTEFCPTERVERGRRVLARESLCTAEGEAISVDVVDDGGWLMFEEVEMLEDGAGGKGECFADHGLVEKKAEMELEAPGGEQPRMEAGTAGAKPGPGASPGWRDRHHELKAAGPEMVPVMEKALQETMREEERRKQAEKRAEWKAKMDKEAGGKEKEANVETEGKEGKAGKEAKAVTGKPAARPSKKATVPAEPVEPPRPDRTGEMTTDEQEMDIVESVLKKLDIHKQEETKAKARPKEGRLAAFSASDKEWSEEGLVCRSCVKPILAVTDLVRCKCGKVYHRDCVAREGRCLNCRRIYRGKVTPTAPGGKERPGKA